MYRKHMFYILFFSIIVGILSWHFNLNYEVIASDAITFISIAIAVYMAAIALPLGNKISNYMKKQDKYISNKTHMGVLCSYLKYAILTGLLSIIDSCLALVISEITFFDKNGTEREKYPQLCGILSSFGFSLFAINIIFAAIIFKYILSLIVNNSNCEN